MAGIKTGSSGDVDVSGDVPHPGVMSTSADISPGDIVPTAVVVPAADVGPLGSLTPELFENVVRRVSNSFMFLALSAHSKW
jgi:hypothetical protein